MNNISVFSRALRMLNSCQLRELLTTLVVIVKRDDGWLTDEAECKC